MSRGLSSEWTDALASELGITTAYLAWFDFASGPVAAWTGTHAITPTGSGDVLLDGVTFEPISNGVMVGVGDNSFSYSGSEAFNLSLAIPADPNEALVAAAISADEYQTRTAIIWRAIIVTPASATAAAEWHFRRIRAGSMDELKITNDGEQHNFTLSIEAHASMISNATGSSYLDQKTKFDPDDTSQDFVSSSANSRGAPARGVSGSSGSGGGSGGGTVTGDGGEFQTGYLSALNGY